MFYVEKIMFLKKVSLFSRLQSDELIAVAKIAGEESFSKDALIFREGGPGDKMFLIVSGEVRLLKAENGEDREIASLSAGECFGEMAILTEDGRSLTAVAAEQTVVLSIHSDHFRHLIEEVPSISFQIFKVLCHRLKTLL